MADDQAQSGMPNPRRPHFLASYSADLSSQRLKIPDRFFTHIEDGISGLVSLGGPCGGAWSFELIQQNGDWFFHHGWPAFLRDHFVECGDFLVFRYDGQLHFTVQVFDQSGCEKEAAFHSRCTQHSSDFDKYVERKRGREEAASSGNQLVEVVAKKRKDRLFPLHSECIDLNCGQMRNSNNEEGRRHEGVKCKEATCSKETKPHENTCLDIVEFKTKASKSMYGEQDGSTVNAEACSLVPSSQKVHQSFSSLNPCFVRIMKSFNISGSYTLNIPSTFSVAYLPNCKVKIVLQNLNGERWKVNSVPNTRETGHTLCGGWMDFVCGNDIKLGDICTFELVHTCEFRVHMRSGPMSSCLSELAAAALKTFEGLPKNMEGNSPKVYSKTISIMRADKLASKKYQKAVSTKDTRKHRCTSKSLTKVAFSQSKTANEKLEIDNCWKKVVEDELDRQVERVSSLRSTLHEEKSARSFTSCFPNFVKIMKKFNVTGSYTLNIPYQFSNDHLPKYKTEIVLRNSKGECWTVNCTPASKKGKVHTFCGGWLTFVRENDVKIGDICAFELVGNCQMQVYISRVGKEGFDHQGEAAV